MDRLSILALPGDGIGPEVIAQAVLALETACRRGGIALSVSEAPFGGAAIDECGAPLPETTLRRARESDAILLGAVGGPKWDAVPTERRPERGLLQLRSELDAFANIRPARLHRTLAGASPLKRGAAGFDFVVVRELCGDAYFGTPRGIEGAPGKRRGINTMVYTDEQIARIGRTAFEIAGNRRKRLASVDKANVLEVMALWREVVGGMAREYPDVELSHMYVDNCAMQLVRNPAQFDVIVTANMFGDILSDLAGALTGSIGMLPSASLGPGPGIFEPVHGSAPDIAGTDKANPLAAILSAAMLLEHAAHRPDLAAAIERSVNKVLDAGLRTADIRGKGGRLREVGTREMGRAVAAEIKRAL